jgi:hypothetical protein
MHDGNEAALSPQVSAVPAYRAAGHYLLYSACGLQRLQYQQLAMGLFGAVNVSRKTPVVRSR